MADSVYIESSVVSYLVARASRDLITAGRQAITAEWWQNQRCRFDVYVSALVIEELGAGDRSAAELRLQAVADVPSLAVGPEAETLAEVLLSDGAVPSNSPRDALHIAIAAAHGTDYLLTWNFRHINNAETRRHVVRVVADHGLVCPTLCSPEELGGRVDDE